METAKLPKWYVIHTFTSYENKVRNNISLTKDRRNLNDMIFDVQIPMETKTEIKNGKSVSKDEKMFPGYVFVNMILTNETWQAVRGIHGVTGFIGANGDAIPLSDEEAIALGLQKETTIEYTFSVGDSVRIIDGPLEGFIATIIDVNFGKGTAMVAAHMFGRDSEVTLSLDFLEPMLLP